MKGYDKEPSLSIVGSHFMIGMWSRKTRVIQD